MKGPFSANVRSLVDLNLSLGSEISFFREVPPAEGFARSLENVCGTPTGKCNGGRFHDRASCFDRDVLYYLVSLHFFRLPGGVGLTKGICSALAGAE